VDNTATKQITITPTLYGDADLNGKVDLTDFSILATNFNPNGTGKTWQQGDFDYNGKVDLTDFSILATDFGLSSSQLETSLESSLGSTSAADATAAPEPSSIAMSATLLALGGAWVIGRRRRKHVALGVALPMVCNDSKNHSKEAPQRINRGNRSFVDVLSLFSVPNEEGKTFATNG
jgi:hypothetical protein